MWDGWVDIENHHTHIIGHWNYTPETQKPVYVVSSGDKVELFVNGKSKGFGRQEYRFLFTFDSIQWEKGTIEAVSYLEDGTEVSRNSIKTIGDPKELKLSLIQGPNGTYADGADLALVQIEVVDENGDRCPLANNMVKFDLPRSGRMARRYSSGKRQLCPIERASRRMRYHTCHDTYNRQSGKNNPESRNRRTAVERNNIRNPTCQSQKRTPPRISQHKILPAVSTEEEHLYPFLQRLQSRCQSRPYHCRL